MAPAGTVTTVPLGMEKGLGASRLTLMPPAGAGPVRVTVTIAVVLPSPFTVAGAVTLSSLGARMVMVAVLGEAAVAGRRDLHFGVHGHRVGRNDCSSSLALLDRHIRRINFDRRRAFLGCERDHCFCRGHRAERDRCCRSFPSVYNLPTDDLGRRDLEVGELRPVQRRSSELR